MSLTLTLIVIVLATVVVAIRLREHTLKAPPTVLIYGFLAAAVVLGGSAYQRIQDQRTRDACLYQVSRSEGNRAQWVALTTELDNANLQPYATRLRAALDINLPQRDPKECG